MGPQFTGLDDRTVGFIAWKALRLGGRGVFAGYDSQDLQQDMLLKCWEASSRFDHTRSRFQTFLERVIDNLIASMIEARTATCRDYRRCRRSINEPVAFAGCGAIELGELVAEEDCQTLFGRTSLSARERIELQVDVDTVIATLPRKLAATATLLKSASVLETARKLGVPRGSLYRQIAKLRAAFAVAGLGLDLGHQCTASARPGRGAFASAVREDVREAR